MNNDKAIYKELKEVYERCSGDCDSCGEYSGEESICRWYPILGSVPSIWCLDRLRLNKRELAIIAAFEANTVKRNGDRFEFYNGDELHATISLAFGGRAFGWMEDGESLTV